MNLPSEVQEAVRLGQITLGHAKVLKGVAEPDRQVALCKETILKNYSVHALELLVKQQRNEEGAEPEPSPTREPVRRPLTSRDLRINCVSAWRSRSRLSVKAKDKGQIVIAFDSNDDFERILDALKK